MNCPCCGKRMRIAVLQRSEGGLSEYAKPLHSKPSDDAFCPLLFGLRREGGSKRTLARRLRWALNRIKGL